MKKPASIQKLKLKKSQETVSYTFKKGFSLEDILSLARMSKNLNSLFKLPVRREVSLRLVLQPLLH